MRRGGLVDESDIAVHDLSVGDFHDDRGVLLHLFCLLGSLLGLFRGLVFGLLGMDVIDVRSIDDDTPKFESGTDVFLQQNP